MRILFPFIGDTIGGSHISDIEVIKALKKDPPYTPLCFLHQEGALGIYLKENAIPYLTQNIFFTPTSAKHLLLNLLSFIKSILLAKKILKQKNIDAVYCSDGPVRYIWFYAAKLANVKFILTQHALSQPTLEKKISYRFLDGLIVNSQYSKRKLIAKPKNNNIVISYPIVIPPNIAKQKASPKQQKFTIGFVANIRHVKRPYIFLRMAKQLIEQGLNVHFYMVGNTYDNEKEKIASFITNNKMDKHISLINFQNNIHATMKEFDVIAAPAVDEAFGRVLVEAALIGVPVVAANAGGHAEIIQDQKTGLLTKPDDAVDLAEKITALYNDRKYTQQLSEAAKKHVLKTFSPEEQINTIKTLLLNITQ